MHVLRVPGTGAFALWFDRWKQDRRITRFRASRRYTRIMMMHPSDTAGKGHTMNYGKVFKKSLGQYVVESDGKTVVCAISSRLRKELIYPTSSPFSGTLRRVRSVDDIREVDPVAIGDTVCFIDA